jgi:uncharacterized protein (UPF0210 family)
MKIRSITVFVNPSWPLQAEILLQAGAFIAQARSAYEAAGYEVQTVRLALPPFPLLLGGSTGISNNPKNSPPLVEMAQAVEQAAGPQGFSYISLGPALPENINDYALIPDALAATQNVFFGGLLTVPGGVSLPAVQACAQVIHRLAPLSPDGFTNLRFAALANVPSGSPFLPAAYHAGDAPAFALATEAADLAVEAFSDASSLQAARSRLVASIETNAQKLSQVGETLAEQSGFRYGGIDFSMAPFPDQAHSIGAAMERMGVPAIGLHGSLAAAAILAETLDQARFPRAGFCGLFMPALEDFVLALRAEEGYLTVKDLLLYSAVCGTGLDTIPVPGDTSPEALAAVLLDLAVLAQRLDKPLTARLMPVPGKAAGDKTGFDFAFFANSRVMALEAQPLQLFLAGDETIRMLPRKMK